MSLALNDALPDEDQRKTNLNMLYLDHRIFNYHAKRTRKPVFSLEVLYFRYRSIQLLCCHFQVLELLPPLIRVVSLK
ncbi:hypothetical protein V1477_021133 [Vespula maculifrons]|uniref:Uncharacterized protein n=1 Tax=Vespula maculifrons TaxID=7453 RepID=A0ABD2AH90_VESMC